MFAAKQSRLFTDVIGLVGSVYANIWMWISDALFGNMERERERITSLLLRVYLMLECKDGHHLIHSLPFAYM